ncbi:ABC-ATPase domain-containing protein [Evansella halocellulosilytica]|uniref:ABC-ATPase domain-containing protein n=1 Tax=Evansella halocellulosilytica TaxID=2011013 RepID=UPI000BB7EA4C|nr:ABC-ATPase domain-containing protein [Evansella halocellulosilytica]
MQNLVKKCKQLDGKGYKALKSIQGSYEGIDYTLYIDYVQGDPFASPSRIRIFVPFDKTNFHLYTYKTKEEKIAFTHFFAKEVKKNIIRIDHNIHGSGKSGLIYIDAPGQEMIERTAVKLTNKGIEFRLTVGLPARGRKVLGRECAKLLCSILPTIIENTLSNYNKGTLKKHLVLANEQRAIREYLHKNNFTAFIANGAILPRESGVNNKPLKSPNMIPFQSPKKYEITIPLSENRSISGMGVPLGITMIVGGGYHGKSTLLNAIERGVYNHELNDGREYVLTEETAMKIRSEDGRSIYDVDISPFISDLPFAKSTTSFHSTNASGSTSQAANIMEALEMKSTLLLIDEDTSATNFMIRDARMQQLVNKDKEPIRPFIDNVNQLFQEKGISTILVIGGSGDYFDVADNIMMMDTYVPYDRTMEAKQIAKQFNSGRKKETENSFYHKKIRSFQKEKITALLDRKEKVIAKELHSIVLGKTVIDLQYVEQLIDPSQTRAIANILKQLIKHSSSACSITDVVESTYADLMNNGIDFLSSHKNEHPGDLAMPRKQEIYAAINRIRYSI